MESLAEIESRQPATLDIETAFARSSVSAAAAPPCEIGVRTAPVAPAAAEYESQVFFIAA